MEKEEEGVTEPQPSLDPDEWMTLIDKFKSQLGDKVADVRMTDRLSGSPARLVDPAGSPNQEMQRMYRLLKEDFQAPKKVLELNPHHPIVVQLNTLPPGDELAKLIIDQVYEDALLIDFSIMYYVS